MDKKFIESRTISDWEVETDKGWSDIMMTHKTMAYRKFLIKTDNFSMTCADKHIVFRDKYEQAYVEDVKVGDEIITKNGLEKVVLCEFIGSVDTMYDMEINSFDQ